MLKCWKPILKAHHLSFFILICSYAIFFIYFFFVSSFTVFGTSGEKKVTILFLFLRFLYFLLTFSSFKVFGTSGEKEVTILFPAFLIFLYLFFIGCFGLVALTVWAWRGIDGYWDWAVNSPWTMMSKGSPAHLTKVQSVWWLYVEVFFSFLLLTDNTMMIKCERNKK